MSDDTLPSAWFAHYKALLDKPTQAKRPDTAIDRMIDEPTFDRDSYPTEETLQRLQEWSMGDSAAGLDFLQQFWGTNYGSCTNSLRPSEESIVGQGRFLRLATGGWSANESLLSAFDSSPAALSTWRLSTSGGLHIYRYPVSETHT